MTKKLLALSLIVALVGLPIPRVRADDTDIFGQNVQPNVLIAIDDSGSMGDQIYSAPYDPNNTTYAAASTCSPACVTTTVYKQTTTTTWRGTTITYSVYAASISAVNSASAQTALSTTGYWSGKIGGTTYSLYVGNYLNYLASPNADLVVKMDVAKQVLTNIVNSVQGVRFGLMTFSYTGQDGGKILAPIGSATSTIITAINSLSPQSNTPLGEMLRDAGNYYKGLGDHDGNYKTSPVQYSCQPNFVILMSDGLQNGSLDIRTLATTLHTSAQKIVVDTVGFAIGAADAADGANDIMQTAATNGGGSFYSTTNQATLETALMAAISRVLVATFTFATPVIPTTQTSGTNRAYMAAFESNLSLPFWQGYLSAYNRDSTGNVPVDSNGVPCGNPSVSGLGSGCTASALAWEAGAVLSTLGSSARNIYTYLGGSSGSLTSFTTSLSTTTLSPATVGLTTQADRDNLINFLRGKDAYNWFGNGTSADRPAILGDIFHSTPVLIPPPFRSSTDSTYATFATANASRTTILLAGANDGMLHAFRESDGRELWAFIPPNLLASLTGLTVVGGQHQWFVDGSPVVADVKVQMQSAYVTDSAATWRTIVLVGERRGGTSYYALDITNTGSAPTLLWSFTDADLGQTYSTPIIGTVKMADGSTKYMAFMGGGYEEGHDNTLGKAVFAIDLATGSKLWEYKNVTGATDDRKYMNFSLPADMTGVDLNNDGFVDRLYIGDVGGQVWKFDVSAPATLSSGQVSNWTGKRLFLADSSEANPPASGEYYPTQAIWDAIIPAYDQNKNAWIYFGTGDRDHPDNTNTVPNRFYGIEDNTTMTNGSTLTEANLVNVTTNNGTPIQGWYMTLGAQERVLSTANVFNYIVYFSTFTPTTTTTCGSGGGTANLYAVQEVTGYAALDWSNSAAPLTTTNASVTRSKTIGTGIPSKPVVVVTDAGTTVSTSVIAATTSQQLPSNPAPPPSFMRKVLYWREVF